MCSAAWGIQDETNGRTDAYRSRRIILLKQKFDKNWDISGVTFEVLLVTCSVGFGVLTAAMTNMSVLWVVVVCTRVKVYQRFKGRPDRGGSKDLSNTGKLLSDCTALQKTAILTDILFVHCGFPGYNSIWTCTELPKF